MTYKSEKENEVKYLNHQIDSAKDLLFRTQQNLYLSPDENSVRVEIQEIQDILEGLQNQLISVQSDFKA